jgi:organic radical activating enzyme
MNNDRFKLTNGCPILDYEVSVDTDGLIYPCCNIVNYKFENLPDLREWQSKQKNKFLKNQWPKACHICKTREKNSNYSVRIYNQTIQDYDIKSAVPQIKDMQVAYKNLCNLSCIMCDSNGSSTIYEYSAGNAQVPVNWAQGDKKHLKWNEKNLDLILDAAPSLRKITFLGGEPFLIKEYYTILKKLSASCNILVVTNGTIYNQQFINELMRFDNLDIMFSVDGYGIVNEALRLNSSWNVIEKNILKIKEQLPKAKIGLCPTWTSFNIFHWQSLKDWAIKHQLYYLNSFWQNIITYPEHLKLCYLSEDCKKYILENCDTEEKNIFVKWFNESRTEDLETINNQWNILKNIGLSKGFDYEHLFPHIYQDLNTFQQR